VDQSSTQGKIESAKEDLCGTNAYSSGLRFSESDHIVHCSSVANSMHACALAGRNLCIIKHHRVGRLYSRDSADAIYANKNKKH